MRLMQSPMNLAHYGEVPKLAEGTPLERVQVVNSGARVQIPPSPFLNLKAKKVLKKVLTPNEYCARIIKLTVERMGSKELEK